MGGKPVQRKLVVLGDGACGKTSLLTVFTKGYFPTTYPQLIDLILTLLSRARSVFENYVEMMQVDDETVELSLWDTAGQEDFDRLRSLSYADTHVVMICFSVDSPTSLENVEAKWIEEVTQYCPGVKIILIALKCDLREDEALREKLSRRSMQPVSYDQGLTVARAIKASRYLECSAKHNRGVQEAVYEAARVAIGSRPKGGSSGMPKPSLKGRCIIL